jgi:hypothetical protein
VRRLYKSFGIKGLILISAVLLDFTIVTVAINTQLLMADN